LLVDWGIARRLDDAAPASASVMGTLGYMAPECLRGGVIAGCPASDVFSLGMILFELLTGLRPFRARQGLSLAVETCLRDAPDVRRLNPSAPASLARACALALARDPADRKLSAASLAQTVERWLEGDTHSSSLQRDGF
jgi:serine/threonine-protein kinase